MIKSWSWSRYADYTQCPRRAKFKHVDRLKEPGSPAMDRGAALHDVMAKYILGKYDKLPEELYYVSDGKEFSEPFPDVSFIMKELKQLRARRAKKNHGMTVEDDWAFTKKWLRTRWDDWSHCWVRIKLDLAHTVNRGKTLIITDWKSGRFRQEEAKAYEQQLSLYALAGLLLHPDVEFVTPRLVYLDHGIVHVGETYSQEDVTKLQKLWDKRTKKMFLDDIFPAAPTQKCRWCWFGQAKKAQGGPGLCEF